MDRRVADDSLQALGDVDHLAGGWVLVDRRLYWSEVLLVAQVDVVKQRAFARQEGASKL